MISLKNIITIAKFEAKVLWRNWFFRIIALSGVFFLVIFNIAVFSEADTPGWAELANSWMMPYASMQLICIPQVAAVIFLATGLIKKDKKIDTNEVFFVRPISNLDYVLGKALALLNLFILLHLVLLSIPLIVNLTNPYATFNPAAYIIYPLLTSVPSIVFTTGISFLVVTLIRNQPITIVLLLGVAGVQLIYYFDQFSNILDFMAFRLPMFASDLIGFVDIEFTILHRSFYFLTGIALLFITAYFLDRLASNKSAHIATALIGIMILACSSLLMIKLWDIRHSRISFREQMIAVNDEWIEVPNVDITSNHIDIKHTGKEISGTSAMVVKNNTNKVLKKIYFTLNPSLKVDEVLIDNKPVGSDRNLQVVSISNGVSLAPDQQMNVSIKYTGTVKGCVPHLEVDQERYESANEHFVFSLPKKYSFLQPEYVLLTKDVLWYPDTQIGYSRHSTAKPRLSFIDFELKVETTNGLMAISQGKPVVSDNVYHFKPEYPLPQISLTIGNYLKKDIVVDSVTYSLFHYPESDYYEKSLDQLSDTLSYLITDIVHEYEDAQKLSYPFKRLQFVETPIQFTAYKKIYENHQAYLQPEMVLLPEEGGDIDQFDFRNQLLIMDKQAKNENIVLTDKQKQANVFNDLVKNVFTKQIGTTWVFEGYNEDKPDYSVFPNYYAYNSGVVSSEWELLNRSIATYLRNDKQTQNDYSRNINGISFTEECNNLMREASLTKILTEAEFSKISKSIALKSQYLFSYLGQTIGEARFKDFLYDWVNSHQHELTNYKDFRAAVIQQFNLDIDPIIKKVFFETSQPAFEILDLQKYEVLDGDRKRYQVLVKVKNSGENDGVIEVRFNTGERIDDDDYYSEKLNEEVEEDATGKFSVIRQGETKLLGFTLDEKPNDITLNTIISRNIPSVITMSIGTLTKREDGLLFDGEKVIREIESSEQYEVIVDNEDPGFSNFSPIKPTILKAYMDSKNPTDKKYHGSWSSSYSKWLATTGSDFYGAVIRSAYFTRSGSGNKIATWTPELKEEGFYDIYVYMKGKNQNEFQGNSGKNREYTYQYIINHGDGKDNVSYNISKAESGWNYIGSYYFFQTGGSVSLTDECELRTVYADAIKWVKQ